MQETLEATGLHGPATGKLYCPACGMRTTEINEMESMKRHLRTMHKVPEEQATELAARLAKCSAWLWQEPEKRTNEAT